MEDAVKSRKELTKKVLVWWEKHKEDQSVKALVFYAMKQRDHEWILKELDLKNYLEHRITHLKLEFEKIPFVLKPEDRDAGSRKLKARLSELRGLQKTLSVGNMRAKSDYELRKATHLEKMKVAMLKGEL